MATELRRRRRNPSLEEEDATKLMFGPDFEMDKYHPEHTNAVPLNLSQTRLLIQTAMQQRNKDTLGPNAPQELQNAIAGTASAGAGEAEEEGFEGANEVLRKTQEYLATFARFRDEQTATAVDRLLDSTENSNLHPFEIAQLGSLVCDDAEEAKSLIPSLSVKKSDEELQVLLDHLRRFG